MHALATPKNAALAHWLVLQWRRRGRASASKTIAPIRKRHAELADGPIDPKVGTANVAAY
jgi:hypothetical protein